MELERIIYDTIEVLPEPPAISAESPATPVEEDDNEEVATENRNAAEDGDSMEDEDELQTVSTDIREPSLEPQRMESTQPATTEQSRFPTRRRAPPNRYESKEWTKSRHSAYMLTTLWTESMEPHNYREAVNHPLYRK